MFAEIGDILEIKGDIAIITLDRPEVLNAINDQMIAAYLRLHEMKLAHSVEVWHHGELAGGLYGVSIRGAFDAAFTPTTMRHSVFSQSVKSTVPLPVPRAAVSALPLAS